MPEMLCLLVTVPSYSGLVFCVLRDDLWMYVEARLPPSSKDLPDPFMLVVYNLWIDRILMLRRSKTL